MSTTRHFACLLSLVLLLGALALGCVPGPGSLAGQDVGDTSSTPTDDADAANDREQPDLADDFATPDLATDRIEPPDQLGPDANDDARPPDTQPLDADDVADLSPDLAQDGADGGEPLGNETNSDLGAAPPGTFQLLAHLEVNNDRNLERIGELASSAVPIPKTADLKALDGLVVVSAERWIPAQFRVLSRWGGPVSQVSLPVRWLQVTIPARVDANSVLKLELRRYDAPVTTPKIPSAVVLSPATDGLTVATGRGRFELRGTTPGLLQQIDVDLDGDGTLETLAFQRQNGDPSGPRLVLSDGTRLDPSKPSSITIDSGPSGSGFEIIEDGPLRAIIAQRGNFVAPGHVLDCRDASVVGGSPQPKPRFGWSLLLTFVRASRDVEIQFHIRNECGDALTTPLASGTLSDQSVDIREVSFNLSLPLNLGKRRVFTSGDDTFVVETPLAGDALARIEQLLGQGSPWQRRAEVAVESATLEQPTALRRPLLAYGDDRFVVAATMPWMATREPQSISAQNGLLSLKFVSQPITLGEAKGLWNFAKLRIVGAPGVDKGTISLADERDRMLASIGRGLLVRTSLDDLNASGVLPRIGGPGTSTLSSQYGDVIEALHSKMLTPSGQWTRAKLFGSQIWPDYPWSWAFFTTSVTEPSATQPGCNAGDALSIELTEFLRSGDPRWAWDLALPLAYTYAFTATYNIGENNHGRTNGFCVSNGGTGLGNWHRGDYADNSSFGFGLRLAYLLRPNALLLLRFAQSARSAIARYDQSNEGLRESYEEIAPTNPLMQRLDALMNCDEFVPTALQSQCRAKLQQIVEELVEDNFIAGLPHRFDKRPTGSLWTIPVQDFASWVYPVLDRYLRQYGDLDSSAFPSQKQILRSLLVETARNFKENAFPLVQDTTALDPTMSWKSELNCTLGNNGTTLASCAPNDQLVSQALRPYVLTLLLAASRLQPALAYCSLVKKTLDDARLYGDLWESGTDAPEGWSYNFTNHLRGIPFALGEYEVCGDP